LICINKKFPDSRKFTIDGLSVGKDREMIVISSKIPICEIKSYLKNKKLSFSAYFLSCFAQALSKHPEIHAIHSFTGRLISFESLDIGILIEIEYENDLIPIIHIVRSAESKTVKEISDEIKHIQANPLESKVFQNAHLLKLSLKLPAFIRRFFLRILSRSPKLMKREAGVAVVTSIGMLGISSYVFAPPTIYNVSLSIGGINNGYLYLNLSANHRTIDGAPFARFVHTFENLVKNI